MATVPARDGQLQRPRLRVVRDGMAARPAGKGPAGKSKRRARASARFKFAVATSVLVCGMVFGLVLLNIMVVQSSFRLADIQVNVAREQADYRRMRYEVARAESPARVAEVAAGLGLRIPLRQEYILGRQRPVAATGFASAKDSRIGDGNLKAVLGP